MLSLAADLAGRGGKPDGTALTGLDTTVWWYSCRSPRRTSTGCSAPLPTPRRDIVRRAIDGEEGVAELAEHYPMTFAAVQKHVAILERAGLVTKERIGRRKVVRANLEGLRVARRLLDQYEAVAGPPRPHGRARRRGQEGASPMTVTAVHRTPRTSRSRWTPSSTPRPPASGSCGPTRASSNAGGGRPASRHHDGHDLRPGGRVEYHMTTPKATRPRGSGRSPTPILRIASPSATGLRMRTAGRTPTCRW